jgi:Mg2+-importing ATPase
MKRSSMEEQYTGLYWSVPAAELLQRLETTRQGLTSEEARWRLERYGHNLTKSRKKSNVPALLWSQFKSPIILILIVAAGLSFFLRDATNAAIILTIVIVSGLLGFWQEHRATNAVQRLLILVQVKATVLRDGNPEDVSIEDIIPGDIVILNAGDAIPGDCIILESSDLFVDESTLTGESYPAEKATGTPLKETPLNQRMNTLLMGTHVVSGSATAVVVNTGTNTEFGKLAGHLRLRPPETEFERGIRRFGYLLMEVTMILVIAVFVINMYMSRPFLDSLLFSLALAVGLTPQLLPAIISVNLARGAKIMADHKVIVKRLASIENFGSMNVLCSDKTGTLTEGLIQLQSAATVDGQESDKVFLYAYLNALYQTGYTNPIDEAIRTHRQPDVSDYHKLDEVPYDFIRRRLSVLVSKGDIHLMITKGALPNILAACASAETTDGKIIDIDSVQESIQQRFQKLSGDGLRVLGIAYRDVGSQLAVTKEHEAQMTFLGLLIFFDPPKAGILDTVNRLKQLGVSLKVISGDNRLVTANVSEQVGLPTVRVLTGPDLRRMNDEALLNQVNSADVFAEIEPNQKERIILALKKTGNVVGYMGDGINDASALHAADVGISVDGAVDVAKDAADIILLERDLGVLVQGVQEGRKTFTNTLKYVFMATSANFGNMFSMAGASLFLSFLPLLPRQILLTNLMTDLPEMTIATDSVDQEAVEKPRRWNIKFIRNFMITFGILSSVFDYLTFGVLLLFLHAGTNLFRTGWFIESVVSASLVVLVIRSRRPFFRSKPGRYLLMTTLAIAVLAIAIPFTPLGTVFGFVKMQLSYILIMLGIVVLYILAAEMAKRVFYTHSKL